MPFFHKAYPLTQLPLPRNDLEIICQKKVGKAYVTFSGIKNRVFLVVLSNREFKDPGRNLLTASPKKGSQPEATMDWGYVFDRNHDGKVDYLAFLVGLAPVIPDNWKGELPNLKKPITGKELKEVVIPKVELLFWHMADDNADGNHDAIAVPLRNVDNGWIDSWIVSRDTDFNGQYDSCKYFEGKLVSELGECAGSPAGYHVANREPIGLKPIPPNAGFYLSLINEGAGKCQFGSDSFHKKQ